jgi:hypothetical protein
LKKRSKKLLVLGLRVVAGARASSQAFGSRLAGPAFFQKRTAFC